MDYADVIYDQAYRSSFHEKLNPFYCNACLTITGAITETSSEKLYQELGLESLKLRRWFRKLRHFCNILNETSPKMKIPNLSRVHETRHSNNIPAIHKKHDYFKSTFFTSTLSEWNKHDWKIRNSGNLLIFKKDLLNFIRSCANSIFDIHNPYRIKLLTRLRLGLCHLRDHKFRRCFQDALNPLCNCGNGTETLSHFFFHCPSFHTPRQTLLNNIRDINEQILSHGEDQLIQTVT